MSVKVDVHGYCGNYPERAIGIAASAYLSANMVKSGRVHWNGYRHTSSIRSQRVRPDHCRQLQARDSAIHEGDRMQEGFVTSETSVSQELIERFKSVLYLHVMCSYISAADTLATGY